MNFSTKEQTITTQSDMELADTPLPGTWTFWFYHRDRNIKSTNYFSGTHKVMDFTTPKTFWQLYANLTTINALSLWTEYQIFREGIKPMWEDPHNAHGGRWALRFKRKKPSRVGEPDYDYTNKLLSYSQYQAAQMWESLLLEVVSGSFAKDRVFDDLEVLGIVVSVRREEYVISVWNKTATDVTIINAIRSAILEVTGANLEEVSLEYSPHSESMTKVQEKVRSRPHQHNNNHHHHHHHHHHNNHQGGGYGYSHESSHSKRWGRERDYST